MGPKLLTIGLIVTAVALSLLSLWESSHCTSTTKNYESTHNMNVPPHMNEQNSRDTPTEGSARDERSALRTEPLLQTEVTIPKTCKGTPPSDHFCAQ